MNIKRIIREEVEDFQWIKDVNLLNGDMSELCKNGSLARGLGMEFKVIGNYGGTHHKFNHKATLVAHREHGDNDNIVVTLKFDNWNRGHDGHTAYVGPIEECINNSCWNFGCDNNKDYSIHLEQL